MKNNEVLKETTDNKQYKIAHYRKYRMKCIICAKRLGKSFRNEKNYKWNC